MERKLNFSERVMWAGGSHAFVIAVCATFRGQKSVEEFQEAIRKARQKHPLVGVRVTLDKKQNPWFVSEAVPECGLRTVDRHSDEDALREIRNELATPFAWEIGPLVRFVLVRSADVTDFLVVCHHCVTDGIGTAILMRDIINFLLNPGQKVEVMPSPPPWEDLLPDFVKEIIPSTERIRKKQHEPFLELTPSQLDAMRNNPQYLPNTGNLQFYSWELPEDKTTALLSRCRKETVRIHSAICTAFGFGGTFNTISSSVSVRNRLRQPIGDQFGTFATGLSVTLRMRPGQEFWGAARRYQKQFERHLHDLPSWVMLLPVPPIGFEKTLKRASEEEPGENQKTMLIISNVGDLDAFAVALKFSNLHLERVIGAGVAPQRGAPWLAFGTIGGKIRFNLIYWDSFMEETTVKEITNKAMGVLTDAIGLRG